MNGLNIKNLSIVIFLVIIVFFAIPDKASAGQTSGSWDFLCSRHGINDYKNCGTQQQTFPNNYTYYQADTSYQFLGHRHGGSSFIQVSVCISLGGDSQCDAWSCSGYNCGTEYGWGENPFDNLAGWSMTASDNSSSGWVTYFAEV